MSQTASLASALPFRISSLVAFSASSRVRSIILALQLTQIPL